jgi:antitoxin component of MazEF toxin-antitoxin module
MVTAEISEDGRLTLPAEILEKAHLQPGARVSVEVEGNAIVLHAVSETGWRSLRGLVKEGESLTVALEREHAAEIAADERA